MGECLRNGREEDGSCTDPRFPGPPFIQCPSTVDLTREPSPEPGTLSSYAIRCLSPRLLV